MRTRTKVLAIFVVVVLLVVLLAVLLPGGKDLPTVCTDLAAKSDEDRVDPVETPAEAGGVTQQMLSTSVPEDTVWLVREGVNELLVGASGVVTVRMEDGSVRALTCHALTVATDAEQAVPLMLGGSGPRNSRFMGPTPCVPLPYGGRGGDFDAAWRCDSVSQRSVLLGKGGAARGVALAPVDAGRAEQVATVTGSCVAVRESGGGLWVYSP